LTNLLFCLLENCILWLESFPFHNFFQIFLFSNSFHRGQQFSNRFRSLLSLEFLVRKIVNLPKISETGVLGKIDSSVYSFSLPTPGGHIKAQARPIDNVNKMTIFVVVALHVKPKQKY
jgi:hypothetical protein